MLWQAWHMPCLDFSNFPQPVKKLKPAGRISIYLLAGNIYFGRSIKDCHACDFASDTPMTMSKIQPIRAKHCWPSTNESGEDWAGLPCKIFPLKLAAGLLD